MTEPEFDPRWEWIKVDQLGLKPVYVRGYCKHLETEPVISLTGEHVAQLCRICDAQLPPGLPT